MSATVVIEDGAWRAVDGSAPLPSGAAVIFAAAIFLRRPLSVIWTLISLYTRRASAVSLATYKNLHLRQTEDMEAIIRVMGDDRYHDDSAMTHWSVMSTIVKCVLMRMMK